MPENTENPHALQEPLTKNWLAPTFNQLIEKGSRQLTFLTHAILFIASISFVVFAISELAARETMLSLMNSRSAALKSEFVERTRANGPDVAASSPKQSEQQTIALLQIEEVEDLKRGIQSLSALGAEEWQLSLRAIHRKFSELTKAMSRGSVTDPLPHSTPFSTLTDFAIAPLLFYSSDQLLAIVVLGCGAVGAMISSLRSHNSLSLSAFILGLASGFVTYLIIKGGRHFFLMQTQGELVVFNPYGSAFAGLLAGLFTEKAHQLLSFLVDDLASRIKAASVNSSNSDGK